MRKEKARLSWDFCVGKSKSNLTMCPSARITFQTTRQKFHLHNFSLASRSLQSSALHFPAWILNQSYLVSAFFLFRLQVGLGVRDVRRCPCLRISPEGSQLSPHCSCGWSRPEPLAVPALLCSHFPCNLCLKDSTCARTAIYPQRCRVSSKPRMISYHSDFKSVFNRLDKNDRNIKRDKAERNGENREQDQTK